MNKPTEKKWQVVLPGLLEYWPKLLKALAVKEASLQGDMGHTTQDLVSKSEQTTREDMVKLYYQDCWYIELKATTVNPFAAVLTSYLVKS